ncbi:polysaccharide deacetylase family protein [Paenibacillus sp. M1]|uniref:Polysaccharide deacetylase family protein n=1 Tax=Paenibacillus haidiansis TaxID=1574488 RepID=A0ABU7VRU7_9BACL
MRKYRMPGFKTLRTALLAMLAIVAAASVYGEQQPVMPGISGYALSAGPALGTYSAGGIASAMAGPSGLQTAAADGSGTFEAERTPPSGVGSDAALTDSDDLTASTVPAASIASAAKPDKTPPAPKREKVVYLTFDDGPSKLTDEVLSILDREGAQATFFVLGEHAKQSPEIITRIAEAGHAIGNHTYNHEYSDLYSSFPRFWEQIKRTEEILREITGVRPVLVRAPGGTYGHFDETYFELLEQGGYKVFDWDVDSGDSKRKGVPAAEIVKNATSEKLKDEMIVLLHDGAGHAESVKALPDIIQFYKKHGYTFKALSPEQKPVQFSLAASAKTKAKPAPSAAWIESHVKPNAALFGPAQPLFVEAGGVETKLGAGEYALHDGQFIVPLRSTMERLGASVSWDGQSRTAVVLWGDTVVTVDPNRSRLLTEGREGSVTFNGITFVLRNNALWLSLRPLLEATGHPVVSFVSDGDERRIKAM